MTRLDSFAFDLNLNLSYSSQFLTLVRDSLQQQHFRRASTLNSNCVAVGIDVHDQRFKNDSSVTYMSLFVTIVRFEFPIQLVASLKVEVHFIFAGEKREKGETKD